MIIIENTIFDDTSIAANLGAPEYSYYFVRKAFRPVLEKFGTIDVLVNNAGDIYASRHFLDGDEAWWDHVLGVNLKGAFLCSLRAAQVMARKRSGNIIHMSSGGATKAQTRGGSWQTTHITSLTTCR